MRHLLMDPAYPDIVGEWARQETCGGTARCNWPHDNDNDQAERDALSDPLFELISRAEIDATRAW